jgi:hypothetical protein
MSVLIITGLGHTSKPSWPKWCSVNQMECQPASSQARAISRVSSMT